jgi:hypothetical protein
MATETHEFNTQGVYKPRCTITKGAGIKTPITIKSADSLSVYKIIEVAGFSMSGSFSSGDFTPGVVSTILTDFPSPLPGGAHEITPFNTTVTVSLTGTVGYEETWQKWTLPDMGTVRLGFGTQRQYFETGNFIQGLWCTLGGGVANQGLTEGVPHCTPYLYIDAHAGNNVECNYNQGVLELTKVGDTNWEAEIEITASFTWGFTGEQYQPDYYYHYCRYKKFNFTAPEGAILTPDPIVEDIPFSDKIYMDAVEGVYRQVEVGSEASWSVGWACSWPGYHYQSLV